MDMLLQGITMTSFQVGLGSIRIYPRGTCSCGHLEVIDGAQVSFRDNNNSRFLEVTFLTSMNYLQPPLYLMAGKISTDHLKDSLFDENAAENKEKKRDYKQGSDNYHFNVTGRQRLHKELKICT